MKTIAVENSDFTLRQIIDVANSEPVVITENGTPKAAIIGVDEETIETFALGNNPDFLAIIERSRESYRRQGGIPLRDIRREIEEGD